MELSGHLSTYAFLSRIPVVDIRGTEVSTTIDEDDEDLISFDHEDGGGDYNLYDYLNYYDSENSARKKRYLPVLCA